MKKIFLFLALAAVVVLSSGCCSSSGSREFIPGKGWKLND
jgi:hypothetical protein